MATPNPGPYKALFFALARLAKGFSASRCRLASTELRRRSGSKASIMGLSDDWPGGKKAAAGSEPLRWA